MLRVPPQEPTVSMCHQHWELQVVAAPCFLAAVSLAPAGKRVRH